MRARQTIAPNRQQTQTFHDIVPRRHSTVAPTTQLTPLNDVTSPLNTATAPQPADVRPPVAPTPSPTLTDIGPTKSAVTTSPLAPKADVPEPPIATSQAELLKASLSTEPEDSSSATHDDSTTLPPSASTPDSESEVPKVLGSSEPASDALRDDLKTSEVADTSDEQEEVVTSPEAATKLTPLEEEALSRPNASTSASGSTLSQSGPTTNDGLIDPEEGRTPSSAFPAKPSEEKPMQLFDTTQYHTPIAAAGSAEKEKGPGVAGRVKLVVAIIVIVAVGVGVYMFMQKG
jgi:hypothetical protein